MNESDVQMVNGQEVVLSNGVHGFLCKCPQCEAFLAAYVANNASDYLYERMVEKWDGER